MFQINRPKINGPDAGSSSITGVELEGPDARAVLDAASAEIERQNREKAEKQRRAQEIANRCACW